MALRISENDFEEKVIHAGQPVLLDFYSDTCIPCKRMAGTLSDVEEAYENRLCVYKVNVNYDGELAERFEVLSAPTLVLFADGKELGRLTGAAGRDEIERLLAGL